MITLMMGLILLAHLTQTGCNMSFFGIGQNPDYFHRPSEFCPERFMPDPPAEFKGENHEAYHPFSIGAYNVRTPLRSEDYSNGACMALT